MEPNPYQSPQIEAPSEEPPKEVSPLSLYRDAKRNLGLAIVFLLTPPAMVIATFGTCAVGSVIGFGSILFYFGVPATVLVLLLFWAARIHARWNVPGGHSKGFYRVLWATPFCVAGAVGLGIGLGILAYADLVQHGGNRPLGEWTLAIAFFTPPSLTLVVMLALAWRNR